MMKQFTYAVFSVLLACYSAAYAKQETFIFVDLQAETPIPNAEVELFRFATDVSYDNPPAGLTVAKYRTDADGAAQIDTARIPLGHAVFHVAGYWTARIRYSPVLDRLAMPGNIQGQIRIVRFPAHATRILGNSIYDLDARKEYFADLDGNITTNDLETIRIEMKRSEQTPAEVPAEAAGL